MYCYEFGSVICELRERQGMTQEQLSEGICSAATVSKIERGLQFPNIRVAEALFLRLGGVGGFASAAVSLEEARSVRSYRDLVHAAGRYRLAKAETDIYMQQLYELVLIVEDIRQRGSSSTAMMQLLEVLSYTAPLEAVFERNAKAYTYQELCILNCIAVEMFNAGSMDECLRLLGRLKTYLDEQFIDNRIMERLYPVVMSNYSAVLMFAGYAERALSVVREGIDVAIRLGYMPPMAGLYGNLCNICTALGRADEARDAYLKMQFFKALTNGRETDIIEEQLWGSSLVIFIW